MNRIACAGLLPLLLACASGPRPVVRPTVTVAGLRFAGLTLETVDFFVDLNVDNPNSFPIETPALDFDLAVDGEPFMKENMPVNGAVRAGGRTKVSLPVKVNIVAAAEKIHKIREKDEFPFRVEGGLTGGCGELGTLRFPFQQTGKLPIPKTVGVKIDSFKREKGGNLFSARARLTVELKNRNIFALSKVGGRVKVAMGGAEVGEFDAAVQQTIGPGQEGHLVILMELKGASLLSKAVTGGVQGGTRMQLTGALGMATPYGLLRLPIAVDEEVSLQ